MRKFVEKGAAGPAYDEEQMTFEAEEDKIPAMPPPEALVRPCRLQCCAQRLDPTSKQCGSLLQRGGLCHICSGHTLADLQVCAVWLLSRLHHTGRRL